MAFLSEAGVLGDAAPRVVATHGAHVFLTGRLAYKLKRAIRYDYLDFGDRAARNAAALAEVELNRRTAPDLYLGLTPVYQNGEAFRLGVMSVLPELDPDAAEHLVAMRRFPDGAGFDELADAGDLTGADIDRLADEIARFHTAAPIVRRAAAAQRLARLSGRTMKALVDDIDVIGRKPVILLNQAMQAALITRMSEADDRGVAGCIKRLHGDLHLGNVAKIDGAPVIFDCIEFDDDMATVDVLHDLAFLVMDLWARGLPDLAARAWSRYRAATDDYSGQALAPLFIAMRAAVRAKIDLHAAKLATGEEADAHATSARRYVEAALAAFDPPTPRLIAIGGLSGVGKTTLARALAHDLAPATGALHLRSDVLRKRFTGVGFEERAGSDAYSAEMTARVYDGLLKRAEAMLKQGWPVILDAMYARPEEREAAADLARRMHVPFTGVWLDLPTEARQARIADRQADASDATPELAARQADYDLGDIDWRRLDADSDVTAAAKAAIADQ